MRVFRVVLPLLAMVGAMLVAPGVASAAYSDPLTTTTKQSLVWHATPTAALTALDSALPNVSANTVVNDANYAMTGCNSNEKSALPKVPTTNIAMCWDADRAESTSWVPQGITTSGDADDDGLWGPDKVILSGWHGTDTLGRYNDARIHFINYNNPSSPAFRMVYLAVPNSTGSTFSAAKAHMGGMAWYGDKIYVSAVGNTNVAIRVFSTAHILQMTDSASAIGRTSAGYAAYGYKYAMMQVGYYTYASGTCGMSSDTGVPCFSSISLDRSTSPDSLVTTEYFSDQSLHGRLYRYGMGANFLLNANSSGTVAATDAFRSYVGNMQGVLSNSGKWYVAHSSAVQPGSLWTQTTAKSTSFTCGTTPTTACWAVHPEALTYDWATGLVWSQSEWSTADCAAANQSCGRAVFAVPLSSLPA
ncbi:hypothetical protein [Actinophytocola sp.]|uniref:hypothetical protein n=1 Tax=Actinophytocola sp. TaxID=1872138 RepID=UPI002ED49FDF